MIELVQTVHHQLKGTYLAYTGPGLMRNALPLLSLGVVNRSVAKAAATWLSSPAEWLEPPSLQSLMVIQPCDIMPDGRQSMCDGCPDIIPYEGRLTWSCRVDELEKYGAFVSFGPKE